MKLEIKGKCRECQFFGENEEGDIFCDVTIDHKTLDDFDDEKYIPEFNCKVKSVTIEFKESNDQD